MYHITQHSLLSAPIQPSTINLKMIGFKVFSLLGLALGVAAQGSFGASENSAKILSLLVEADKVTVKSGQAAAAYTPNNQRATKNLENLNAQLLQSWQAVTTAAQSSQGFYTASGAQAIVDFLNKRLGPDTTAADLIYTNQRDTFVKGGFIDYINPGLLKLRTAVDAASAAVKTKTPAKYLTPMDLGFLIVVQNYANTQEIQQFGGNASVFSGSLCTSPVPPYNSGKSGKSGKSPSSYSS